ncbi:ABC transporter permease [Domibacillus sp. DTU_2020_1001157_1_SI_ALB_TIR_016]|uniref:ABC transporter permease n=1 Tax=Domibacillus sp. DTU_2020_1001157_1_SI_ALB_TIR_016 TaxID=3077789 RepID=UPI0028E61D13|nr:ABC transporter permease [Domibacillus sp. DTU_2020_1001157_1_SI_ALB_TIR_016]WNS82469.1 ABC transporter permease [Domibacillus sp. DTU_2020_1001157_1_SI_ALB_TIR_016]
MTFRQFAFNNVFRNKRLYAAYFLSSLFSVMVFFTFAVFAFHPALGQGAIVQSVSIALTTAEGIIFAFAFFYVLYSMGAFLKTRKNEFGLLIMQGMSPVQLRLMVFLENLLIGFFATIGGIGLGLVFAKLILLIAENMLVIGTELDFYMPVKAIVLTFAAFALLFLFISFFTAAILRSGKLIDLMKSRKQSKGEPKASKWLALLVVLLIGGGYAAALLVEGMYVVYALVPVVIVVVAGTYFLFTQLSVYIIRRLKEKPSVFWKKTNMLLFSDLSFRMKDNARTFFMVAIVSTVAFSAIGTLYGFQSLLNSAIKEENAYSMSYTLFEQNEKVEQQEVSKINKVLESKGIEARHEHMLLTYFQVEGNENPLLIVKVSDFNRFADMIGQKPEVVSADGAAAIEYTNEMFEAYESGEELTDLRIPLSSGGSLKPNQVIETHAMPVSRGLVVQDSVFEQLGKPVQSEPFYVWMSDDSSKKLVDAGRVLSEELQNGEQPYFFASDFALYTLNAGYGPTLFVGLFIGMVFFMSAGSILYFRLYSDLDDDKEKFKAIAKMGLTEQELKRVLNQQIALLFFSPIVIALIHGIVALTALSNMFYQPFFIECIYVLLIFTAIQIVYFFIVRYFYIKQIKSAL